MRRCCSGEIVVFHDERLGRLTDGVGAVSEFEYAELAEMTIGNSAESIPTLADALDALPADTGLNIELKEAGLHERVLELLSEYSQKVIVSSFDPAALKPLEPATVPTALLCARTVDSAMETALEIGCEYLHPQYTVTNAEAIQRAHEHGLSVNAWTVTSTAEVRRLSDCGIDGVIVDTWTIMPAD